MYRAELSLLGALESSDKLFGERFEELFRHAKLPLGKSDGTFPEGRRENATNLSHGLVALAKDDSLSFLESCQVTREMGLGFMNI